MSALSRCSVVERLYRSKVICSLRSVVSVGATVLMKASAVGPHLPPVSKTKGMSCGWFWYRFRLSCSRACAAVASWCALAFVWW